MNDFLATMRERSTQRLADARAATPLDHLQDQAAPGPGLSGFGETFDLIAEVKPASPSEGELGDPGDRANQYAAGGAAMISVLTEPSVFGGSLDLLRAVAAESPVPVLRKDFLVDPYQVWEAAVAGASGVLLITRMLGAGLEPMLDACEAAGVFALVEAFDTDDLAPSLAAGRERGTLVGVNARDLATLEVRPDAHQKLAPLLEGDVVVVAESGITSPADAEAVARLGYRGALVGSMLMRSSDPRGDVAALLTAARRLEVTS